MAPRDLVLRCYGYKNRSKRWYGVCLDLNLAVEADSVEELKRKMREVINCYLDSVIDTEDKGSIGELLTRKAPLLDWAKYYLIGAIIVMRDFPGNLTFKETIPFHLSYNC